MVAVLTPPTCVSDSVDHYQMYPAFGRSVTIHPLARVVDHAFSSPHGSLVLCEVSLRL